MHHDDGDIHREDVIMAGMLQDDDTAASVAQIITADMLTDAGFCSRNWRKHRAGPANRSATPRSST